MQTDYIPIVSIHIVRDRETQYKTQLCSMETAAKIAQDLIGSSDREEVLIMGLDNQLKPTVISYVGIGAIDKSLVDMRNIFKTLLLSNSSGFFLFHNHPSGTITPSAEDDEVTRKLCRAGRLMDMKLIDHIIVNDIPNTYFSYRESRSGIMEAEDEN